MLISQKRSVLAGAAVCAALSGGLVQAQDCNDLLNPNQVLTFNITMDPADWETLRFSCPNGKCPEPPHSYFQALLQCGSGEQILVGIRRKSDLGEPSETDPQKVSLKLDINEFVPDQTFAGKKKLSLECGSEGATITEGMAYNIYQATGIICGRAAWVNVYVNGDYKGLYNNVEQVDKVFLADNGLDDGGWLIKEEDQRTREDPLELNAFAFNWYPFDHPDPLVYPEVPTPADWLDQTLWRINMPHLLKLAVTESLITSTDSVFFKMTNYFYYDWSILPDDDPAGQQPRLYFPWDQDTTMKSQQIDSDILSPGYGSGHLKQGLIEELDESGAPFGYPTFQDDYFETYRDLLNGPLALSQTLALVNGLEPVVGPHLDADPYQQAGSAASAFQHIRDFLQARTNSVVAQLAAKGQGYQLQTFVVGNGSVIRNPDKPTVYDPGEVVELTAVADPGWHFVTWADGVRSSDNPLLVTMDTAKPVTAFFAQTGQTVVIYDFNTNGGADHLAYGTYTDSWAEDLEGIRRKCPEVCTEVTAITADAYTRLALSDALGDDADTRRYVNPDEGSQDESTLIVEFNIAENRTDVLQIDALWEGYGDRMHHMELYVWNYVQGNWGNGAGLYGENNFMADGSGDTDFILEGSVSTGVREYVSPAGQITLLVYDDAQSEDSFHDYVRVVVTVPVDCNDNGVPDDQDLAGGTSLDCNTNGIPDECDISAGTSQDTDTSGIPDECEGCQSDEDCDDGVGCTDDACVSGSCVFTPGDGNCDDGLFCNGAETCDALLDCQAGTPVNCDDGVGCTDDSCNEITDSCDHLANDANCDNGVYCDGAETCDMLLDCQSGTAVDCDDAVTCTVDSCNETTDSCDNIPDDGACDDGLYCNGPETCDPLSDCQGGSDPCPGQACDEPTDTCLVVCITDSDCDDGLYCNGAETCPDGFCQAGSPVDCTDGVGCTDDTCNEATGSCDHVPNDASCDNGLYCDGVETCDPVDDCQPGTPVGCDDGVGCTDDSCNEATDACDNLANDANCDNGVFCDGAETCDPVDDCQAGVPVDCSDGVDCTDDTCDAITDSCDNVPNDAYCDNGQYCDGVETCDALADCQAGTAPCPGQGCDEVSDVCVPPVCNTNGVCEAGEDCNNCPGDCFAGSGAVCGNGVCEAADGEDCLSCSADCNGKLGGKPSGRYCCGDGTAEYGVTCDDSRCTDGSTTCTDEPAPASCCGDGLCEGDEDVANCLVDCGCTDPAECDDANECTVDDCVDSICQNVPVADGTICASGICCGGACITPVCSDDPECDDQEACTVDTCIDGGTCLASCDYAWPSCGLGDGCCGPACTPADDPDCDECLAKGEPCTADDECCSSWCHRGACK